MVFALLWGVLLALVLEFSQLLVLYRHASAVDFSIKSVGTICGILVASAVPIQSIDAAYRLWGMLENLHVPLTIVGLCALLPMILFVDRFPWFTFRTWDPRFTLQIANEATRDKPWLGTIYRIAIYSRALSAGEIAQQFQRGSSAATQANRPQDSLVVSYTFHETSGTTVHDSGSSDPALDLSFFQGSAIRWLGTSRGIEILEPTIIQSWGPATKLYTALKEGRSLAIEAWIRPANTTQMGAARIISFAGDIQNANFMLGQDAANLVFWLRTALSGGSGTSLQLGTPDSPLGSEAVHIVATYDGRIGRFYVNGKESPGEVDVATDMMVAFASRKSLTARIAYSFFYFFPFSFVLARSFSTRYPGFLRAFLLPTAIAAGLLSLTELFQAFSFARAVDLPLIGCGFLISAIGVFSGMVCVKRRERLSGVP